MGADAMSELPAGFVVDDSPTPAGADATGLPNGFVIDPEDGRRRIIITPNGRPDRRAMSEPAGPPGVMEDMARAVPPGLAKGVAGLVGLPGAASGGINWLLDQVEQWARGEGDTEFAQRVAERKAKAAGAPNLFPSADSTLKAIQGVTGDVTSYKPQTMPGHYAETVAEFLPGAMMGPSGPVRNAVNFAVVPGIASEAAGQMTAGTNLEPWARAGAALAAGGAAAVVNPGRTAARAVSGNLAPQVDRAVIDQAAQLMDDAAARGVQLTWAEAIEQVSPGAGLVNTQRLVESMPGGREVMGPMMAARPGQVENAARQTFDTVAPRNPSPSNIGPAVGNAAEGVVNDVRGAINTATEPLYQRSASIRLTSGEMARVRALPGFEEARNAVRNDPQLNRYVASLPDDSVGFLNEVKKYLDQAAENAAGPVNANRNMQRAAGFSRDAGVVRRLAGNRSPEYASALAVQSVARERFLDPLMSGPLGKLAAKDTTTRKAIEVLFPANPLPGSEAEVAQAVAALARRNTPATRDLLRAYFESTFNEAAQNLQGGANQMGGAKFASVIAGNPQQRANLEAAIRASGPDGDLVWSGFNRFLDIVEATGKRQPIGSRTAFNTQDLADLSTGAPLANASKLAGSPGKWLSAVGDAWSRWQLGNNVEDLARILTDRRSRGMLKAIAGAPRGANLNAIAGQLALDARAGYEAKSPAK
jgi:hypothetical protein